MVDKKLKIAVVIIILLALTLLYVTVVKPKINGYFSKKQVEIQTNTVKSIISVVDQRGYITINDADTNRTINLINADYCAQLLNNTAK